MTQDKTNQELNSLGFANPPERLPSAGPKLNDPLSRKGFNLLSIGELLSRPEIPPDYLVENLLVRGTVSCVVAKPKVGKSTFARRLCLAVARGERFLGCTTRQGKCIYLALEERSEEITADFRAMGADGTEPIRIHAEAVPSSAIRALTDLVREERPSLVVIDPLFRLTHVRDGNAYAEVYAALGPLIDLARETGTHILVAHHSSKALRGDAIDSPLGSTAIGGAVATLIVLTKRPIHRTIETVTRIGPLLPETILLFEPETRMLSLGVTREEASCHQVEEEIIELLKAGGEKTELEIDGNVRGANAEKRKALRSLVDNQSVARSGTGKKGEPFKYSYSRTKAMVRTSVQETECESTAIDEKESESESLVAP